MHTPLNTPHPTRPPPVPRFLHQGARAYGADTPASLGLPDGVELTAVPESTSRALQARELGPLFAGVFGGAAPGPEPPLSQLL